MGTRGLYGFRKGGVDKTTYNHYDSYPSCLGYQVAEFCIKTSEIEMNRIYDRIILVSEHETPSAEEIRFCQENDLIDFTVSLGNKNDRYCLYRGIQGDLEAVKSLVRKRGKAYMIDNCDFIKDSLFCEYAYIINLDTHMLEFWRGFQTVPQDGNRYGCGRYDRAGKYYPCRLVLEIPLDEINDADEIVCRMNEFEDINASEPDISTD